VALPSATAVTTPPGLVTVAIEGLFAAQVPPEVGERFVTLLPVYTELLPVIMALGTGFTVTVILVELPTHEPVVEVGVTAYTMLPGAEVLGFVKTSLIVEPELAVAPVMAPVLVPKVQAKLLAAPAVKLILALSPLQIVFVVAVVTAGFGFTVTVIGKAALQVAVTLYTTLPAVVLLELDSVCAIVEPLLALCPVIPPVTVPNVQE